MDRRMFLQVCGGVGASAIEGAARLAAAAPAAGAGPVRTPSALCILIHVSGGWDVTLSLDPRNARAGATEPASTRTLDTAGLRRWVSRSTPVDGRWAASGFSFELVRAEDGRSQLVFGPAIGDLLRHSPRLTVVNGIAMDTVSHQDGAAYAVTGRHLVGHTPAVSSVDAVIAETLGGPLVSLDFPSFHMAPGGAVRRHVNQPEVLGGLDPARLLAAAYPRFRDDGRGSAARAATAVELLRQGAARCVSFACGGFDTHFADYRRQGLLQQDLFDLLATLLDYLDGLPHPGRPGRLSDHTHVLVVSDFCRAPGFNASLGRDHHPTGSALIVSPRVRGGARFGETDGEHLLPLPYPFKNGPRPITPVDVLATFVMAVGAAPQGGIQEGEVMRELLA